MSTLFKQTLKKGGDYMNCEDFGKYLDNYENLTAVEKCQMLEHAALCEKCKAELDFFMSMIATAYSLPKIEPPADFMEKLGARLDAEDKKAVSTSKIIWHVRRNWKQYTAAAACLALVTVITANRTAFLDPYVENDDNGVISEETVPAGNTEAPAKGESNNEVFAQPTPNAPVRADTPQAASTSTPVPFSHTSPLAVNSTPVSVRQAASKSTPAPRTSSAVPVSSAAQPDAAMPIFQAPPSTEAVSTPSVETASIPSVIATPTVPAQTDTSTSQPVRETVTQTSQAAAAETKKPISTSNPREDYDIAHINNPDSSVAHDIRAEDVKASIDASEVKSNYSLAEGGEEIAYGRYYTLDRNGNPLSSASGIGSIKISSEDAELAMEIIDRYPHDENGNVYTTDSVNLTRILSKLKSEGVNFTDYTLGDTGEVKFKVIFY